MVGYIGVHINRMIIKCILSLENWKSTVFEIYKKCIGKVCNLFCCYRIYVYHHYFWLFDIIFITLCTINKTMGKSGPGRYLYLISV